MKHFFSELILWADRHDIAICTGINNDNEYLCEYKVIGKTKGYCKSLVSELKKKLKTRFPKIELVFEISGEDMIR